MVICCGALTLLATCVPPPQDSEEEDPQQAVVPGKMDPELYCFCRRGSFGYMIGCDDDECAYEWFHLECVGLTPNTRPRGKWYVRVWPGSCGG